MILISHSIKPLKFYTFINHFRKQLFRTIFSSNGVLDSDLTNDVKKEIEKHWKTKVNDPYPTEEKAQKFYLLSMFPYPSGNLHMGHVRVYAISDAIARFLRMRGKQVIHPIGWDAFGLPAENAAIERNVHPAKWTKRNIETMKQQLQEFNLSFDWERELATCDASYYQWTQYIFLLLYKHGLAYKKQSLVNWDPVDQTVLADEQVDEKGCSWRSGCKVEKRRLSQWFLRTSEFSKDLYEGLDNPCLVEWRDAKKIQKHWIGEPDGVIFHLEVFHNNEKLRNSLTVWTDKPELIYGATFLGISPDNHFNALEYGSKTDVEDCLLDITVKHPFTGKSLPIFVTTNLDHSPSTDSCFGIPIPENIQHLDFAKNHNLDIIQVLDDASNHLKNSGELSSLDRDSAREIVFLEAKKHNVKVYKASKKLRDWLISRQRYWGTPIPIINCPTCKTVPVSESDLPILLPEIAEFSGKSSSLKGVSDWTNVKCPKCGGPATRETDTMDTFVDSSWYFLRYLDVSNKSKPFDTSKINDLMPVDLYIGGKEHAGLHMFYARFLCHFFHSIGLLKHKEPFVQLLMQGMVMGKSYRVKGTGKYITKDQVDISGQNLIEKSSGLPVLEDWEKMSKSKYNGVDPQEVIKEYGIDTTRLFILGNVAPQSPRKWNDELFPGIINWQWRLWLTVSDFLDQKQLKNLHELVTTAEIEEHKARLISARNFYIKGVTHNFLSTRQLNVVVSKLQGLTGELRRIPKAMAQTEEYESCLAALLIMLAPIAPHFASELWTAFSSAATGSRYPYDLKKTALHQKWPEIDENCEMEINVKLNGEEIDSIPISRSDLLQISADEAIQLAVNRQKVLDTLQGAKIKHARYVTWPDYDSDVFIVYIPLGKKAKKYQKSKLAKVA